ncbi:hypothetical protein HDU92_002215 [Lobulomyces angularis]|nr:hypothetical protein HDU92_002215 [Lobulomyces angularis]
MTSTTTNIIKENVEISTAIKSDNVPNSTSTNLLKRKVLSIDDEEKNENEHNDILNLDFGLSSDQVEENSISDAVKKAKITENLDEENTFIPFEEDFSEEVECKSATVTESIETCNLPVTPLLPIEDVKKSNELETSLNDENVINNSIDEVLPEAEALSATEGAAVTEDSTALDDSEGEITNKITPSIPAFSPLTDLTPANPNDSKVLSVRALISSKDAGIVIGKQGKNVVEIRETSDAAIVVSGQAPPNAERILTVTGTVMAVSHAFSLIGQKMIDNNDLDDSEKKRKFDGTANGDNVVQKEDKIALRLLVPHARVGAIIGKSGATIRDIQDKSSCFINVSEDMLPGSTERAVTINGPVDGIRYSTRVVAQILLDNAGRSTSSVILYKPPSAINQVKPRPLPNYTPQYYQARPILPVQPQYSYQQPQQPINSHPQQQMVYSGHQQYTYSQPAYRPYFPPSVQHRSATTYSSPYTTQYQQPAQTTASSFAHTQSQYQNAPQSNRNPQSNSQHHLLRPQHHSAPVPNSATSANATPPQHQIVVSKVLAGAIIGKGGIRINEIRNLSGCTIKIEDAANPNDRLITVHGAPEGVQMAMFMFQQRIESERAKGMH